MKKNEQKKSLSLKKKNKKMTIFNLFCCNNLIKNNYFFNLLDCDNLIKNSCNNFFVNIFNLFDCDKLIKNFYWYFYIILKRDIR